MKKYTIFTLAPVLALFAVGCSSPVAMQSSEYDDMYYSSTDETVYVEPVAQQRAPEQAYESNSSAQQQQQALADGEVLNPEYSDDAVTQNYNGDEYYDGRTYDERDNWYRPNHSYVDPAWGMAYIPRRASYAYYDPFYDPFFNDPFYYDPFWNNARYRSGLSVNISYGMGMGRFYGSPYYGGFSNWWPNSYGYGYYNGYNRGFNNGYYANNPYNFYQDRPVVLGPRSKTQYGPRDSRSRVATSGSSEQAAGRPARGEAVRGERTEESRSREAVGRQSRSSRSTVAPATGTNERVVLPARPSRRSNGNTTTQPQEQRTTQPAVTPRPSRRVREVTPSRSSEQTRPTPTRTRTMESRPARTYESRPSRSESRPVQTPTYERSSGSSSGSSTGSSSGGGRPTRRGNN